MTRLALTAALALSGPTLSVTASSHRPLARDVRLTVTVRYEMQCGYPGEDPLVLDLAGRLPAAIARSAVLVDGKPATAVHPAGRILKIDMRPRPQIMCDSITEGALTVTLTPAAHLTSLGAGRYTIVAEKGHMRFSAPFVLR